MRRRAFTLVELLVVVSIIAILIALLLPALAKARTLASQAVCAANIRSLLQGCFEYAQSYGGQYPLTNQYNYPMGGLGGVGVDAWGIGDLYSAGILTDPAFIYCPESAAILGPQGELGQHGYVPGAPPAYLPDTLAYLYPKGIPADWYEPSQIGSNWFWVATTYCYWYKRPNGVLTGLASSDPQFSEPSANPTGTWINPVNNLGVANYNYANPANGLYTQTPTDSGASILITDLDTSNNGSWEVTTWSTGIYCNHFNSPTGPDGANIGYNDGSVSWKPLSKLTPGFDFVVQWYR